MKKCLGVLSFLLISSVALYGLSHLSVGYHQGVFKHGKYSYHEVRLPLFLKGLEFITRHFQTSYLAHQIIRGKKSDKEKIEAIMAWVMENIIKPPSPLLPIVDDHPWHIIVRGYGASDQIEDVFSLLNSYVGFKSYVAVLVGDDPQIKHPMTFIFYNGAWRVMDICHQTLFLNVNHEWATFEELKKGDFQIVKFRQQVASFSREYYMSFFKNMEINESLFKRNMMQMPLRRILMFIGATRF